MNQENSKDLTGAHRLYLAVVATVFSVLAIILVFFPRTTYSELEKRDLATFPDMAKYDGHPGAYTAAVSQWFSDSEPFRDKFMGMSMLIRDGFRVSLGSGEEVVTFRPNAANADPDQSMADADAPSGPLTDTAVPEDGSAKVADAGIILVGTGPNVRALMAFGGNPGGGKAYIDAVNSYAEAFPGVKIYALISPTASAFYLPEKASKTSRPQGPVIEWIHNNLGAGVRPVDAFSALSAHRDEDIYLRTDHHWAPLGGYYAAQALAKAAGVPFRDLQSYDRRVVHGYVGSMFGYSKDISVKNAPEDFVYHVPNAVDYKTTYVTYTINKSYQVTGESKPYDGRYFHHFKDGSGGAYCTFMGGDQHLVKVKTGTPGSRKLLIIKDSFGNTLPGYLFYSFSEIHVVDFRYFTYNMKEYVKSNGITDLVVALNIFNAYGATAPRKIKNFLTQRPGVYAAPDSATNSSDSAKAQPADTAATAPAPAAAEPAPETEPANVSDDEPELPAEITD